MIQQIIFLSILEQFKIQLITILKYITQFPHFQILTHMVYKPQTQFFNVINNLTTPSITKVDFSSARMDR